MIRRRSPTRRLKMGDPRSLANGSSVGFTRMRGWRSLRVGTRQVRRGFRVRACYTATSIPTSWHHSRIASFRRSFSNSYHSSRFPCSWRRSLKFEHAPLRPNIDRTRSRSAGRRWATYENTNSRPKPSSFLCGTSRHESESFASARISSRPIMNRPGLSGDCFHIISPASYASSR